jgi:hypothetical protein
VDAPPAGGQVLGLHDREAEQGREEGDLEGGLGLGARAEQGHPRQVQILRRDAEERRAHRVEEAPQPRQRRSAVQPCHHARGDPPVGHRITRARGHLGPVGDRRPRPGVVAHQIGRDLDQLPISRQPDAVDLREETGMSENEFRGEEAFAQEAALAIQIGQDEVENEGTLAQAGLQTRPFVGCR